ncbi:MAG: type II toxin-antitoxin system RelE/ParE family toxin [Coriobacteriia bacterium]|nr:type II toxin-antitoxin system RelE/ParE family toxin [Coriobacteriia bacterium]MCL2537089.1 type II toxin-antitoxin system RelE/ParE family toxin [Coriobacteriia bacterium]
MNRRIRFTPSAKEQLDNLMRYIASDSPSAARDFKSEILAKLENLCTFPEMGRRIPEYPNDEFRELIIKKYRFFYTLEGSTIWIVGIWRGSQIPGRPTY